MARAWWIIASAAGSESQATVGRDLLRWVYAGVGIVWTVRTAVKTPDRETVCEVWA